MKNLSHKLNEAYKKHGRLTSNVFIVLLILFPFFLTLHQNVIQSYTDFFVKGDSSGLSAFTIWTGNNFGSSIAAELWRLFPLGLFFYTGTNVLGLSSGVVLSVLLASLYLTSYYFFVKTLKRHLLPGITSDWPYRIAGLFYIFNTFSLTQLSNSFLLVLPYLVLPVQVYLLLSGLKNKQPFRYGLLLGIVNGLVFGVNLIFDVIAFGFLFILGLVKVLRKEYLKRAFTLIIVTAGVVTFLIISFWLVPQLLASFSDKATTNYVLSSESFYNLDSSIFKVLRGLGDWGFFGSNAGVPYYNYSSSYLSNFAVIISGFIIPGLAILPLLLKRTTYFTKNHLAVYYVLLLMVITFIGGTHDGWFTAIAIQWAFDHIPYFQSFRNTYKFASLEMFLLALLLAFSSLVVLSKLKRNLYKVIFSGLIVGIVLVNAFPYFTGRLYSPQQQISSVPAYWTEMASYVNKNVSADSNILMLPDQYFEVFNWNGQLKGFPRNLEETLLKPSVTHNTCRGCGSANSSALLKYVYANLNKPETYRLLGSLGVNYIIQRNDYAWQYYNVQSPSTIAAYLNFNPYIQKVATYGELDLYKIKDKNVNDVIYSPKQIIESDRIENFSQALSLPYAQSNVGFALTDQLQAFQNPNTFNYYTNLFKPDTSEIEGGRVNNPISLSHSGDYTVGQTSSRPVAYSLDYTATNGLFSIILAPYKNDLSIDGRHIKTDDSSQVKKVELGSFNEDIAMTIGGKAYLLRANSSGNLGSINLTDDSSTINVYSTKGSDDNGVSNGNFENGLWQPNVTNCKQSGGNAGLKQAIVKNLLDGSNALELSATQDVACAYSPSIANFTGGVYLYSFASKNVKGNAASYCIWDGTGCETYNTTSGAKQWTTTTGVSYLGERSSNINIYLYSEKSNYPSTVNDFDNVKIVKLTNQLATKSISVAGTEGPYQSTNIKAGQHVISNSVDTSSSNLVANGSFEGGAWQDSVSSCSGGSTSNLRMGITNDSADGKNSLKLESTGDIACTSSAALNSFNRDEIYKLSVSYKILSGDKGQVCVWDGSDCIITKPLEGNKNQWYTKQFLVSPSQNSQLLSIYLYAPEAKVTSTVLYDDIKVERINNNFVNKFTLQNSVPVDSNTVGISNINKVSDARYEFDLATLKTNANVFFQQSFNSGWKFLVKEGNKVVYTAPEASHFIANSYANGWSIDKDYTPAKNVKLTGVIEYGPQNNVLGGIVISASALIVALGTVTVLFVRTKRQSKK